MSVRPDQLTVLSLLQHFLSQIPQLLKLASTVQTCGCTQGQLARIATMYIPWLSLVLENLQRLSVVSTCQSQAQSRSQPHIAGSNSSITHTSTPQRSFQRGGLNSTRASVNLHIRDSAYFAAIAGQGQCLPTGKTKEHVGFFVLGRNRCFAWI